MSYFHNFDVFMGKIHNLPNTSIYSEDKSSTSDICFVVVTENQLQIGCPVQQEITCHFTIYNYNMLWSCYDHLKNKIVSQ